MSDFLLGIAPEHRVALVCALLTPLLVRQGGRIVAGHARLGAGWAVRLRDGWRRAGATTRWSAWLLLLTGVVHLALPLGHTGSRVLAVAFAVSGGCAAYLAGRAVLGRPWRRWAALLCVGFLLGYAVAVASGREDADQVGLGTAVLEVALLALLSQRVFGQVATILTVCLFGTTVWLGTLADHNRHDAGTGTAGTAGSASSAGSAGSAGHDHGEHVDRAQAGIVQRPVGPLPTVEQRAAAANLAAQTKAATLRYRDIAVAEADGYRASGAREGLQVHYDHKGHQHDRRILDPQAPEQLVYAIRGGRSLLLGVVYQLPVAGVRGPAIGGSSTRWHAHNVCVGLLPPGFGAVNPFGTCPAFTVSLTIPEMMHVWVVDPPGGPYAEHLDDAWVATLQS